MWNDAKWDDDGRIIEVVPRHHIDPAALSVVEEGSIAPTIYAIPMPPVRPDSPNFARSFGGELLAINLVFDPQAAQPKTWYMADMAAQTITGRFRPRGMAAGFDRNDKVSGWRAAFWWALIARDATAMTHLAEFPVERLRGFGDDAFDDFQYQWANLLQTAWREGPESVTAQLWALDTTSRVGAQHVVDHLLRPAIDVFTRLAAGDQEGFTWELARALRLHRAFFDTDTWRGDPEGVLSLPLLGIACWATDLGMRLDVESDYLPSGFITRPDWARSPELEQEHREADQAAEHAQPAAQTAVAHQRIAAILAATTPAGWNLVAATVSDSDDAKYQFTFRYRDDTGAKHPFDPGIDAVRDIAAVLTHLSEVTDTPPLWLDPRWWFALERDGEIQVWSPTGPRPMGPLTTRYVPRHTRDDAADDLITRTALEADLDAVTAPLERNAQSKYPLGLGVLNACLGKAYETAGLVSAIAVDGRSELLRDSIDIAANTAVARLQSRAQPTFDHEITTMIDGREYRVPGTGEMSGGPSASDFLHALWPALISRNHRLTDFLLGTAGNPGYPAAAGRLPGREAEFLILWAEAWQAAWTGGIAALDRIDAAVAAIADEPEDSYESSIMLPALRLLANIVEFDDNGFDVTLADALERHRRYWSSTPYLRDQPLGFIAWPLLATVCYAKDYSLPVDLCSAYLPAALIPADWTEKYRREVILTPQATHDHTGDPLHPIRLGSTGRWELLRFAAG